MHRGLLQFALIAAAPTACLQGAVTLAEGPSREELQARIAELEARVKALEVRQERPPANARDEAIQNVLRDTDRRSQVLATSDGLAGYDEGFFLKSADESFLLRPVILFQFRGIANHRNSSGERRVWESGFEARRMEFSVEGHALTPKLTYEFLVTAERDGGGVLLEDAFIAYEFADAWGIVAGQFKDPLFHEQQSSSKYMLAVDRSLVNELIAAPTEFVQGLALVHGDDETPVHWTVAFHDGAGSINSPFLDAPGALEAEEKFGVTGRLEYRLSGDWENYEDFTAKGTERNLLVLGAAADWTQAEGGDVVFATIDAQWESPRGVGAYGALLARHAEFDAASLDLGALLQAAFLLTPNVEVYGRYGVADLDDEGDGPFHEITTGFNYYLGRDGALLHRAKITFDVTYLPSGAPTDASGVGILESDEEEFVLRGQFQLLL